MNIRDATLVILKARQLRQTKSPFKPLAEQEIRLLCISPGNSGDPLKCSLVHYSLAADVLTHTAISYPWGPPEDPHHDCFVDGVKFRVRDNAFQILTRLRQSDEVVQVWIDCLCIDQENKPEKSAQIRLMFSIYQRASRTIIWLGRNEDTSDEIIDCINSLPADKIHGEFAQGWEADWILPNKSFILDLLQDNPRKEYLINGIARLFFAVYFTRVWIRQEAAVGGNPYVLWGIHQLSWKQIAVLAWLYVPRATPEWPDWFQADWAPLTYATDTILSINGFRLNQAFNTDSDALGIHSIAGTPLYAQIFHSRSAFTTKAHDKVYALTGLCSDLRYASTDRTDPLVKPNYSLSWQEVYVEAAKFFSQDKSVGDWQLLSVAGLRNQGAESDLPSWVPDWRYPLITRISTLGQWAAGGSRQHVEMKSQPLSKKQKVQLLSYKGYTSIGPLCAPPPRDRCKITESELYAALGPKQVLPTEFACPDPNCKDKISKAEYTYLESATRAARYLEVRTSMQDRIVYVGTYSTWQAGYELPRYRHDIIAHDAANLKFLDAQSTREPGGELYITSEPFLTAYNTTLIGAQTHEGKPASPELIASASQWRAWLTDTGNANVDHLATRHEHPYQEAIESSFVFREYVFAYTESGYMCLVPNCTIPGDAISVIDGYPTPFVIRPVLAEWNMLLGKCYVHGMMTSMASELMDEFKVSWNQKEGKSVIKRPEGHVRANGRKMEAGRYVDILGTLGSRFIKLI